MARDDFRVEGTALSLRSTDAALLTLVRRHLNEHRIDARESGQSVYEFSADCGEERILSGGRTLRRVGTLYMSTMKLFRSRGLEEMAGRFVSIVRDVTTWPQDDFVRVRAAALVHGDRALLLPSMPEPRLPALAALLVRSGAEFLGDEVVKLDPVERHAYPVPLPLLLGVEDLDLFPELNRPAPASRRLRDLEGIDQIRYAVSPEELGGRRGRPAPVGWIVFPVFEHGAATRLEPIGHAEALLEFAKSGLNFHVWGDRALFLGRELLAVAAVRRLRIGDLATAAELLHRFMAEPVEGIAG